MKERRRRKKALQQTEKANFDNDFPLKKEATSPTPAFFCVTSPSAKYDNEEEEGSWTEQAWTGMAWVGGAGKGVVKNGME